MNTQIRNELRSAVTEHLRSYLQDCASCHIGGDDDLIELHVRENAEDVSDRIVIRIGILDDSAQLHIPNISFPPSWRGKGDGMRLIETIYRVARKHRYALFITHCTDGFYSYLLGTCGASRTDEDTVEITKETRLVNNGGLAVREFGDGYKSSYEAAVEFDEMSGFGIYPGDVNIVHGRITLRAAGAEDRVTHHAWIEVGDLVIETSNGRDERFSKEKFYTQLHAVSDHVYSVAEAKENVEKSKTFGPWD